MENSPSGVTKQEWDSVRERFKSSMMVGTEMAKLASNVDRVWPLKGRDEVPLKYLPLTLDELLMLPGIAEHPKRVRLMMDIFEETMAFDDPFGEMAEQVDSSSRHDDKPLKVLKDLEIPREYPVDLCNISAETRKFCQDEDIKTIGDFLLFAQNMAQNVVVGGDFRTMLNGFTSQDEKEIAKYLPNRPGFPGLHLPEAFGHIARSLSPEQFVYMLQRFGGKPTAEQKQLRELSQEEVTALDERFNTQKHKLFAFFEKESLDVLTVLKEGGSRQERYFMVLNDPQLEIVAMGVARIMTGEAGSGKARKKGFFARLFGR
ncbi:MAG: hypothetical protein Q7P63_15900 [Verrucomicrobiota bacterium JB022]|nr:hypothetical protein [Verrucomicrobiota bacterium JB022]